MKTNKGFDASFNVTQAMCEIGVPKKCALSSAFITADDFAEWKKAMFADAFKKIDHICDHVGLMPAIDFGAFSKDFAMEFTGALVHMHLTNQVKPGTARRLFNTIAHKVYGDVAPTY